MNDLSKYYEKNIHGANESLTPFRPDMAANYLKGTLSASCYFAGIKMQVLQGVTPLRKEPDQNSEQLSQVLFGSHFMVYEKKHGWAWGQSLDDYYVGYVPLAALDEDIVTPTHRVKNLSTNLYEEPSGRSKSIQGIPFNSTLKVEQLSGDGHFVKTPVGWVPFGHITQIEAEVSYVSVAEMFITCPYLWGGKTLLGIDCSGLVQVALTAYGIKCPRDTGMQFDVLGAQPYDDEVMLTRGDIIFFPGHVGIMTDEHNIIHANAHHMATVNEPLAHVIDRLKGDYDTPVTGFVPASDIATLQNSNLII